METHINKLKTIVGNTNALHRDEDIQPFLEDWRGQIKGSTPLILFPKIQMMFKRLSVIAMKTT